ncbi:DUF4352 domain-containing protein [Clostridium bornimense]|uniref:DUF4352 domain-containing protein n=1 Tax=Clostridium bornimense TaxID=1216932 RepID=UPI000A011C58|nr:DUF4352 domain-containing protein [Clostridium bornimense]
MVTICSIYTSIINNVYKVESDNQFAQPKEGNQFLAVYCTLENISDKDQVVSSIMMFKVVDSVCT